MRYTTKITIDLPRERVVRMLEDPSHFADWEPGLLSYEQTSGEFGEPGATAKLVFEQRGRKYDLVETVVANDLPDSVERTYETDNVFNREVNRFYEDGPGRTWWVDESEFAFSGAMSVMSLVMGPAFRRETRRTMEAFKRFAETRAVREPEPAR